MEVSEITSGNLTKGICAGEMMYNIAGGVGSMNLDRSMTEWK